MTRFAYSVLRPDGERLKGVVNAVSDTAATDLLVAQGFFVASLREDAGRGAITRKHSAADLARLFSGLGALLKAGLPFDRALRSAGETASGPIRSAIDSALDRLKEGASASSALADDSMPRYVSGMLRAGEARGELADATLRVSQSLARRAELRARIRAAMTYPALLAAAGSISVAVIVMVVIPRFAALLGEVGQSLPPMTRLLLGASAAVTANIAPIVLLLVSIAGVAHALLQRPQNRERFHAFLLDVPIIGELRAASASGLLCGMVGQLLASGVGLSEALALAEDACEDRAIAARIGAARHDITQGSRLHAALHRHGVLAPAVLQLVHFGEETGQLAGFLEDAATIEEARAQRMTQVAVTMLEPALIVLFGGIVALVAAALLQAVYAVHPAAF